MDRVQFGTGAHSEAVAALGVEVAFHRALGLFVFGNLAEHGADVALIVIGHQEERGRSVGGNGVGWDAQGAGINGDLEVAAAIHAVDGVGGVRITGGRAINEHGHGFTTGGEAHRADALRIQVPFRGTTADEAHGALDILARMDVEGVRRISLPRKPMLKNESGNAEIVHELGWLHAFADETQLPMSPAGNDDHGGAGGLVFGRREYGDRGIVDIGDRTSFDDFWFVFARFKPGRSFFPEMNNQGLIGAGGDGADATKGEKKGSMKFHGAKAPN